MDVESVLIVGASVAGVSVAETLRREGYQGSLTLVGDEPHLPYDRPPLSKQVLSGEWPESRTQIRTADHYEANQIELRLSDRATSLDLQAREVTLASSQRHAFDALVIATGLRARRLPGDDLRGVHRIRSVDDATALRDQVEQASAAVVIGAGVLGCEVAATLRTRGLSVAVVDMADRLMPATIDSRLAGPIQQLHRDHGVVFHLGTGLARFVGRDQVQAVALTDGRILECNLVVVAIGASPATDWLESSSLTLRDGVVCNEQCAAAGGVYAAGDVARWFDSRVGRSVRSEHRMNANEQGMVVARNILGAGQPYRPVPYFWTDQYDVKIQGCGWMTPGSEMSAISGDLSTPNFLAEFTTDGRVVHAVGAGLPAAFRESRKRVLAGTVVQ